MKIILVLMFITNKKIILYIRTNQDLKIRSKTNPLDQIRTSLTKNLNKIF